MSDQLADARAAGESGSGIVNTAPWRMLTGASARPLQGQDRERYYSRTALRYPSLAARSPGTHGPMRIAAVALATTALACSRPIVNDSGLPPSRGEPAATARLRDAGGRPAGTVTFETVDGGTRIVVLLQHLSPGLHGVHVHAVGKCEPDFAAAGSHFNPGTRQHGRDNPNGPHAGDLPNVVVGADSAGSATIVTSSLQLGATSAGLFEGAGTAIVVHTNPDDYKTDPAGNSGARVACGVVTRRAP